MFSKFLFGRATSGEQISTDALEVPQEKPSEVIEIIEIAVSAILPNPFQPRKTFSDDGLAELSLSIQEFGVIQPLIVRRIESGYELIAGERRLRASVIAGRNCVPCIVRQSEDKETAEIALIENLQREDLHFFEEAAGYEKLLTQFVLTQEQLSARVGKNQSTIANKLRLLKLPPKVRESLYQASLTERHARALLKIEQEDAQLSLVQTIIDNKLTVKETESLIQNIENDKAVEQQKGKRKPMLRIIKDVRIFINTMSELVAQMNKTGLSVQMKQEQNEDEITITMTVPKRR